VRTLCEDGHAGAEYILTGPQSLTQAEQLHTIGHAIGRSPRVEEMSPDEARCELLPILGSLTVVNMLLNAWSAAAGQPAFVTSTFAELTGAPPRTFVEWATDHAAEFCGWMWAVMSTGHVEGALHVCYSSSGFNVDRHSGVSR
jgi:uncharacterized protein YbjT (DUF2867 family)